MIIIDLCISILLINGPSAPDALFGYLILLALFPTFLIILIDRFYVSKLGFKKVNKIEFYILGTLILLFLLNWVRLQSQA